MENAVNGWRGPPAFQMYAADRLAHRNFRLMTLAERGLLHTIELECWVNKNVPVVLPELARTLGLEVSDVQAAFTKRVRIFLKVVDEPQGCMVCPDLERYRAELDAKHEAQSKGGKKGADGR